MKVEEALKILGVEYGSKFEDVKSAYRKLAMKFHPDKNHDDESAVKKMAIINSAWECCQEYMNSKNKQYIDSDGDGNLTWTTVWSSTYGSYDMSDFINDMFKR